MKDGAGLLWLWRRLLERHVLRDRRQRLAGAYMDAVKVEHEGRIVPRLWLQMIVVGVMERKHGRRG